MYDDDNFGFSKALAMRLNLFGDHHLNTVGSYYNIVQVLLDKGDYDGAFKKAKKISTNEIGAELDKPIMIDRLI